jgi:hypothetical protein
MVRLPHRPTRGRSYPRTRSVAAVAAAPCSGQGQRPSNRCRLAHDRQAVWCPLRSNDYRRGRGRVQHFIGGSRGGRSPFCPNPLPRSVHHRSSDRDAGRESAAPERETDSCGWPSVRTRDQQRQLHRGGSGIQVIGQSVWELGGIRCKAAGQPRWFRKCQQCGQRSWHTISRDPQRKQ